MRLALIALAAAISAPALAQSADPQLKTLYDREWAWRLEQGLRSGEGGRDSLPRVDAATQVQHLAHWRGGLEACLMNTYDLPSRPLYNLAALTLHECNPGHSFQAAAQEAVRRPEFRRQTYFSGYGEGWGLYSEWLGTRMGIYETPYEDFGRLSYAFDQRAFHDAILSMGSVPLPVLEARLDRFIADGGKNQPGWNPALEEPIK